MIRLPPRSSATDTLFPYTTRFRSVERRLGAAEEREFAIDPGLPHAASDKSRHLASEIDDQDAVLRLDGHVESPGKVHARDRSSASQSPVACHAQFLSAPGIAVIQPDAVHAAIAVGACKTHAVAPIVAIITVIAIAPATRAVIIHRPAHTDPTRSEEHT